MVDRRILDWLLEPEQPSIRYLTLTRLLGKKESDPDVREAKARIPKSGWVADTLARRDPGGWWVRDGHPKMPEYTSTNYTLVALSDLGATRDIPEIRASCEYWMKKCPLNGGGVGGMSNGNGHHCYTGNMTRALFKFGYGEDRKLPKALEWLVLTAHPKGGWSCWGSTKGPSTSRTLDSWEGLSAFAAYPRSKWTKSMHEVVEKGAEFFLEKELHNQGARYEPWYRFHWPVHYRYDLQVGLDTLTALGYEDDKRLGYALDLLRSKQRPDGRWNLDANHPDMTPAARKYYAEHPKQLPVPLAFEDAGQPSKMITLRALTILSRVGE